MKKFFVSKKAAALLLIFSLLLTACGSENTALRETGENISNLESGDLIVNRDENTLRLGVYDFDTFNPIITQSQSVTDCMQLVYDPLFTFDETLNPIGVLAESCTPSQDFRQYTIKLRQGIKWHDGSDFTAADVVYTIKLIKNNDTAYTSELSCISDAYSSDGAVVIKLSGTVMNFINLLGFPIVKAGTPGTADKNYIPVGTGPYRYESNTSSRVTALTAVSDTAAIGRVTISRCKDKAAMINAFNAGEINAITSGAMDLKQNTPRGDVSISSCTSSNLIFMGINNECSALSGASTRKALAMLTDKGSIVEKELFSRGAAADSPINPSAWFAYHTDTKSFDRDTFNSLLSADGWARDENGGYVRRVTVNTAPEGEEPIYSTETEELSLEILVNTENEERTRIAAGIQAMLRQAEIDAEVFGTDFDTYTNLIAEGQYELFIGELCLPRNGDPSALTKSGSNYFSYSNPDLDNIIYSAGFTSDTEMLSGYIRDYTLKLAEDMPFVPIAFRTESVILDKRLSGTVAPTLYTKYRNVENWYFSKQPQREN